jgi:radical SAM superfamily enzyme with C-terminal helix-hairpin-helix motif
MRPTLLIVATYINLYLRYIYGKIQLMQKANHNNPSI